MLKHLLCIVMLVIPAVHLSAKENGQDVAYRHSIFIGYGTNNVFSFHNPDYGRMGEVLNPKYLGNVNLGYEYRISKLFGVCGELSWCGKTFDKQEYDIEGHPTEISYGHKENMLCLLAGMRGLWIDNPHFTLYSSLKLGGSFYLVDKQLIEGITYIGKFRPYFHIVPLGLEGGAERFRVFLEGGFGVQGFVAGGVRVRF